MIDADRAEFAKILLGMQEMYGQKLSKPAIELYFASVSAWPIEAFQASAQQLMRTCKFMPRPFDFEQLRAAARPTSGEAFARAVKHAASSAYRNGPIGDSVIDGAVMALGGYSVVAMTDVDKLPFLERRFAEHYEAIQDASETREQLPQLMAGAERKRLPQSVVALLSGTKQ